MKLLEINWKPTDRQLRQFAAALGIALPLVGWLWGSTRSTVGWLAVAGGAAAAIGYLAPRAVKPLFIGLSLVTAPIGIIVGELSLLMIYFGVFTPIGIAFRLLGRDPLQRRIDRAASSYWQPKQQPKDAASYYRQS